MIGTIAFKHAAPTGPGAGNSFNNPASPLDTYTPGTGSPDEVMDLRKAARILARNRSAGRVLWTFRTEGVKSDRAALGKDGDIYLRGKDNHLHGIDGKTGQEKWSFKPPGWLETSPVTGPDGTVYIGRTGALMGTKSNKRLFALDPDTGKEKWVLEGDENVKGDPSVGPDGMVYMGFRDNHLYALDEATGRIQWKFPTEIESGVTTGPDGTIYFGSADWKLYALDGKTGKKKWEFETGGKVYSTPAIGPDGTVYFGSDDYKVYALDGSSGEKKWSFTTGKSILYNSPVVAEDGAVYIGSCDRKFYALDGQTGEKQWEFGNGEWIGGDPVITPGGTVLITTESAIHGFKGKTGEKVWFHKANNSISSPLLLDEQGVLFYADEIKGFQALESACGDISSSGLKEEGDREPEPPPVINKGDGYVNIDGVKLKVQNLIS